MKPLRAVLVGLGRIGVQYADDAVMARLIPYASHAQVLEDHPGFDWVAAVDRDERARAAAHFRWPRLSIVETAAGIDADIAVLAMSPGSRLDVLAELPSLRGVIVEKPLGGDITEARRLLDWCRERGMAVQVCYWRRADEMFRTLAGGGLEHMIGRPQAATVLYGNGLRNNGSHMIDFVRMLLGEVSHVSLPAGATCFTESTLPGDLNAPFHLVTEAGVPVAGHPLRFSHYRENGIDIWGETGRLSILNGGLTIRAYGVAANRAMRGESEVECDRPRDIDSTAGNALYHLYTNFADGIAGAAELWSGGESALRSETIIETIWRATRAIGLTTGTPAEPT